MQTMHRGSLNFWLESFGEILEKKKIQKVIAETAPLAEEIQIHTVAL